jgi:hypothetical protein
MEKLTADQEQVLDILGTQAKADAIENMERDAEMELLFSAYESGRLQPQDIA